MVDTFDQILRTINVGASLTVVFLLTAATVRNFYDLGQAWRQVLIALTLEHAVLAYGSWEAWSMRAPTELRVVLFTLSLVGLIAALTVGYWIDRAERAAASSPERDPARHR